MIMKQISDFKRNVLDLRKGQGYAWLTSVYLFILKQELHSNTHTHVRASTDRYGD